MPKLLHRKQSQSQPRGYHTVFGGVKLLTIQIDSKLVIFSTTIATQIKDAPPANWVVRRSLTVMIYAERIAQVRSLA
jgi:hypothetical protein